MAEQTHYLIPAPLLMATLEYLLKRPYNEVADAIDALRSLKPHAEDGVVFGPPPEIESADNPQKADTP